VSSYASTEGNKQPARPMIQSEKGPTFVTIADAVYYKYNKKSFAFLNLSAELNKIDFGFMLV
jgi:hypothetical protein